jgi:hypothetical protein
MSKCLEEACGRSRQLLLTILFVTALAALGALPARAACCSWPNCATGSSCCNIFCCNCDGPCSNYGCKCPPVARVGDVCGNCPGYDTCTNPAGQCTGYCNPGYKCCNNGQSCCSTSEPTDVKAANATKPGMCTPQESAALPEIVTRQPAIERFKAIDKNSDKKISWEEAKAWFAQHGETLSGKRLKELQAGFDKLDKNGDGVIEPGEFDSELK